MNGQVQNRLGAGRFAGIVGIITNILLFAAKITVGLLTSSVSVVADAVNNLSDAGSSAFVYVGYKLSGKPADREHPFGHARIEYLCGLFISLIITVLGVEMLRDSAERIISGESSARFSPVAVGVMALTMAVKAGLAVYYRAVARKIDSQALKAASVDSIGDVFATAAVVVGMLLTKVVGSAADAIIGCIIAVYIIVLGLKLVKESSDTLIGTAPDTEFIQGIVDEIRSYDGVIGIHDLVVHSYGAGRYFVSVHVEVDASRDILESHDMIDNIEDSFRRKRGIFMVVHMDPVQLSDPRVQEMKALVSDIVSQLSAEYSSPASMHDFRVVMGPTHSNLIFDVAVGDSFPISDKSLCAQIQSMVKKANAGYNTVITVDRDYMSSRYGEKLS